MLDGDEGCEMLEGKRTARASAFFFYGRGKGAGKEEVEVASSDQGCDDESVEKDYAIKNPKGAVKALRWDTTEWEAIPLEVFFDNGRVKFKYMWIEKEQ